MKSWSAEECESVCDGECVGEWESGRVGEWESGMDGGGECVLWSGCNGNSSRRECVKSWSAEVCESVCDGECVVEWEGEQIGVMVSVRECMMKSVVEWVSGRLRGLGRW